MLVKYQEKLEIIKGSMSEIIDSIIGANALILETLEVCDDAKFDKAKELIKNVSHKTDEIDRNIVTTLALHTPEAKDLRELVAFLKITNELIRASSNTRGFLKGYREICTEVDMKDLKVHAISMQKSTIESLKYMAMMLASDCVDEVQECFTKALVAENKTDDLYKILEADVLKHATDESEFAHHHNMLRALRKSEKVADRALSIASLLLYARNGGVLHQV